MNIFTNFFHKILAKYSPNAPFLKIVSGGAYPRTPLANAWQSHALHSAKSAMKIPPLLQKYFEPPPPPEMKS